MYLFNLAAESAVGQLYSLAVIAQAADCRECGGED